MDTDRHTGFGALDLRALPFPFTDAVALRPSDDAGGLPVLVVLSGSEEPGGVTGPLAAERRRRRDSPLVAWVPRGDPGAVVATVAALRAIGFRAVLAGPLSPVRLRRQLCDPLTLPADLESWARCGLGWGAAEAFFLRDLTVHVAQAGTLTGTAARMGISEETLRVRMAHRGLLPAKAWFTRLRRLEMVYALQTTDAALPTVAARLMLSERGLRKGLAESFETTAAAARRRLGFEPLLAPFLPARGEPERARPSELVPRAGARPSGPL